LKLTGLVELADRRGLSPDRLMSQLRAFEAANPRYRGKVVTHVGKGCKWWVNEGLLEIMAREEMRAILKELRQLRARVRQLEVRQDMQEAKTGT
jgi:limonene-1,2-epoxide hydrolase